MTESERITLYNDLCDYEQDLFNVVHPPQTKAIDIVHRAVAYVRGTSAHWAGGVDVLDKNGNLLRRDYCTCSACGFSRGSSDFKHCPNCTAKMK